MNFIPIGLQAAKLDKFDLSCHDHIINLATLLQEEPVMQTQLKDIGFVPGAAPGIE